MMVNSSYQLPDPIETERLLAQINEQLAQGTFDSWRLKLVKHEIML